MPELIPESLDIAGEAIADDDVVDGTDPEFDELPQATSPRASAPPRPRAATRLSIMILSPLPKIVEV